MWRRGVLVITTEQFHLTKPEFRFRAGSNPARGVSENQVFDKAHKYPMKYFSVKNDKVQYFE